MNTKVLRDFIEELRRVELDNWLFMHRTDDEAVEYILQEGFKYEDSFQKTSDIVNAEEDYLNYWFRVRKRYGDKVVVLGVDKSIINFKKSLGSTLGFNGINVGLLAKEIDEEDFDHVLSKQYVYGIFDIETGEWYKNPIFQGTYIDV